MSARSLSRVIAPDGVTFLPATRCTGHPAARGRDELPFLWAVGRVGSEQGRPRPVRELDLLLAALTGAGVPPDRLAAAAVDYAVGVVATAPDGRSRLTGTAVKRFLAAYLRSSVEVAA